MKHKVLTIEEWLHLIGERDSARTQLRELQNQIETNDLAWQHDEHELKKQLEALRLEYHEAIHEPMYAGTRNDWRDRCLLAERELAATIVQRDMNHDQWKIINQELSAVNKSHVEEVQRALDFEEKVRFLEAEVTMLKCSVICCVMATGDLMPESPLHSDFLYAQDKVKDRVRRFKESIKSLLERMVEYKSEEFPRTCGACGTPNASCDTDCMDATNMAEHNGAIRRAQNLIKD